MLRESGKTGDNPPRNIFLFMADHYRPPVTIIWPTDVEATLVDASYLPTMLANGYCRNLTDAEAAGAILEESPVAASDAPADDGGIGDGGSLENGGTPPSEPQGGAAEGAGEQTGAGSGGSGGVATNPPSEPEGGVTNSVQQALKTLSAKKAGAQPRR